MKPFDFKSQKQLRSVWREHKTKTWAFYCPHCCISRRIRYFPRPSVEHMAQIGLTAVIVTLLTYQWFSWKGMVTFVPLWIAFETLYRVKFREALVCPHCGFDPHLYKMDIQKAREEVRAHWERKQAVRTKEEPAQIAAE